jgi:hypothetical protein
MSHNPASLNNLSQKTGLSSAELQKRAEGMVDVKTGKIPLLSALDAALVANTATASKSSSDAFAAMGAQSANPHTIDEPSHVFTHGAPQGGYAPEAPAPPSIGGPLALLEKAAKTGASRMAGFCGSVQPPPQEQPLEVAPEGNNNQDVGGCDPGPAPVSADGGVVSTGPATRTQPSQSVRPDRPQLSQAAQALQGRMRGFGGPTPTTPGGNLEGAPISSRANEVQGELDSTSRAIAFEKVKMEIQKMTELQNAISNVMATMHEQGMTAIRNAKA